MHHILSPLRRLRRLRRWRRLRGLRPLHRLRQLGLAGLASLALGSLQALAQGTVEAPAGTVVAIGGALRDDHDAVWSRLVALAGGPGARFVVLATASGDPQAAAERTIGVLQRHGAVATHLPVLPADGVAAVAAAVRSPALLALVAQASGVFITGGAQARLIDALRPAGQDTPLLQALRALLARGGVVAGTSAGAAVLSESAFRDAPDVLAVMKGRLRAGQEHDTGFGLLPADTVVDQHAVKRGRLGRLLPLMLLQGRSFGLSVEEDSAAIVQGRQVEAIGARGVLVADLREAQHDPAAGAFNLQGARLVFLAAGDRYQLLARQLQVAAAKAARPATDPNAPGFQGYFDGSQVHTDMLGDNTIVNAMQRLVDGRRREAFGLAFNPRPEADDPAPALGFEWRLWVAPDTLAWAGRNGVDDSIAQVRLDIRPVRLASPLYRPWLADRPAALASSVPLSPLPPVPVQAPLPLQR